MYKHNLKPLLCVYCDTGSCYVLLVSLYDRLGGSVLRWSRLTGQQWAASTLPMEHAGHYYSTHLEV